MKLQLLLLFLLISTLSFAQQSYSEEQILNKIDSIQSNPFSEEIKETTAEALFWIQKISGIEVMDIELFIGVLKSSGGELTPYLLRGYFFGKVEYVLQNDVSEDDPEAKLAGLNHLVNLYKNFKSENPDFSNQEIEKLAEMAENEALLEFVKGMENRNALSFKTAVVPKSIIEEYEWMGKHYPQAKLLGKELLTHEGRTYDVHEIEKQDGEKLKLYFDTSIIL